MLDRDRFQNLCRRMGAEVATSVIERLQSDYSQPHRAYHNAVHIEDCLRQFDFARHLAERPDEVEAAIWFHDVVYDPKATDNEERSAVWAVESLNVGVQPEVLRRIAAMILATKHDREPDGVDQSLVIDVDLSILGRSAEEFAVYDAAIRNEYSWVSDDQYRVGRTAVLERFRSCETIYHTEFFRGRYEDQARRNLKLAVANLRGN